MKGVIFERTYRDVEVTDQLVISTDKDALTKYLDGITAAPWRVEINGHWWLAFGPSLIYTMERDTMRMTTRYRVTRTKLRRTTSMKHPVGYVWAGPIVMAPPGTQSSMSMAELLASRPKLDVDIEHVFGIESEKT